jgi:hypothetical protein
VDHIRPHRGDMRLVFDVTNLRVLCRSCHGRVTAAATFRPVRSGGASGCFSGRAVPRPPVKEGRAWGE